MSGQPVLILIGIAALFMLFVILVTTMLSVYRLSKAQLVSSLVSAALPGSNEWASKNSFKFVGSFQMNYRNMEINISSWKNVSKPTFFCCYKLRATTYGKYGTTHQASQKAVDFITEFTNSTSLTTGSARSGHSFPSTPGSYKQSFSKLSFDDQWCKHLEAENFLIKTGGVKIDTLKKSFESYLTESISKQMKYIRGLFLWPLRAPYWSFIRGFIWHNKSIEKQYRLGMIKLPRETCISFF